MSISDLNASDKMENTAPSESCSVAEPDELLRTFEKRAHDDAP